MPKTPFLLAVRLQNLALVDFGAADHNFEDFRTRNPNSYKNTKNDSNLLRLCVTINLFNVLDQTLKKRYYIFGHKHFTNLIQKLLPHTLIKCD